MIKWFWLLGFFLAGILCSCGTTLYSPQLYKPAQIHAPLPSQKGEFKGDAYLGYHGAGLQFSYAVDSHLVVLADVDMLNASFPRGYPNVWDGPLMIFDNMFSANIGAGYFNNIGKRWRYELLGGLGYGISSFYEAASTWS